MEYCHVCGIVSREVRGHLVVCCMSDRHGAVSMSSCKNPGRSCASAGYGEHYSYTLAMSSGVLNAQYIHIIELGSYSFER